MRTPAYSRLHVDERRRQLLEASVEVFTEQAYADVSMREIAKRAGISKALVYHYFRSKDELFRAAFEDAARDVLARIQLDPDLPPAERVASSVDGFLDWVEAHEASYVRLIQDAGGIAEVRELLGSVREQTAELIAGQAVQGDPPRALVSAALGWLWFMDAVCIDWLAHRHMSREQVRDMLLAALFGSLMAASSVEPAVELKLA